MIRLNKLSTKRGDKGESDLLAGVRASKGSPVFEALGDIDEFSSWLGLVKSECDQSAEQQKIVASFSEIQQKLITLSGIVAQGDADLEGVGLTITADDIAQIEQLQETFSQKAPEITGFVISGKNRISALCDLSRAVCRRAERHLVAAKTNNNSERLANPLAYLNRLSDLLFIIARILE